MRKPPRLRMRQPGIRTADLSIARVPDKHSKLANPFYSSREWRALVADIKRQCGDDCEHCGRTDGDRICELRLIWASGPLNAENISATKAAATAAMLQAIASTAGRHLSCALRSRIPGLPPLANFAP